MTEQKTSISLHDYSEILAKIQHHISSTKQLIQRHKIEMAWNIGQIIEDYCLTQDEKTYGQNLVSNLSKDIGIHEADLYKMRSFFKAYPTLPQDEKFSWTHYRILSGIKEDKKRLHFERLIKSQSLNSSQLQQEVNKEKLKLALTKEKVELVQNRGKIFHYTVTEMKGREGIFLDLGFGVLRDVGDILPKQLSHSGQIVAVDKVGGKFTVRQSDEKKKVLHTYKAALERVVDGDTIRVSLDLGFKTFEKQILRIAKINAPEIGSEEGKKSLKILEKLLAPHDYVIIKTLKTDIYGRYVADIFLPSQAKDAPQKTADEGMYLNQTLLDLGAADVY